MKKDISKNSRKPKSQSQRVLVVSEGSKIEPIYFKALRRLYGGINRSIEIVFCNSPPSPSKVVECADDLYQKSRTQDNEYDKVFCVFECDSHGKNNCKKALQLCRNNKPSFHAIYSVPCFEYWLLLHLDYTTGEFTNCAEVEKVIKEYMPNYDKTSQDSIRCFVTHEKIAKAIRNARKKRANIKKTGCKTPMINVDELVEYLKNLEEN